MIGKADEVSGKGLRKIKTVLVLEWKWNKHCQGYFQTVSLLASHGQELSHNSILENKAITTRADHSSPWGAWKPRQARSWVYHKADILA